MRQVAAPRHRTYVRYTRPVSAYVQLDIPPHAGYLRMWGIHGLDWYALIAWDEHCIDYRNGTHKRGIINCLAWVEAKHVRAAKGVDYRQISRVALGQELRFWGAP